MKKKNKKIRAADTKHNDSIITKTKITTKTSTVITIQQHQQEPQL